MKVEERGAHCPPSRWEWRITCEYREVKGVRVMNDKRGIDPAEVDDRRAGMAPRPVTKPIQVLTPIQIRVCGDPVTGTERRCGPRERLRHRFPQEGELNHDDDR